MDVQKTVWAGIDFDETALEGFMKIQYEDSKYKSKGQSYEQTIETLKGYAESGEYGCYITTLDDDKALEEYNAKHPDTPIVISFRPPRGMIFSFSAIFFANSPL